jgi:hypothetical protein
MLILVMYWKSPVEVVLEWVIWQKEQEQLLEET